MESFINASGTVRKFSLIILETRIFLVEKKELQL